MSKPQGWNDVGKKAERPDPPSNTPGTFPATTPEATAVGANKGREIPPKRPVAKGRASKVPAPHPTNQEV